MSFDCDWWGAGKSYSAFAGMALIAVLISAPSTLAGGFRDLGVMSFGAKAASDDGTVVVGYGVQAGNYGYQLVNGVESIIPLPPGGHESEANDVSADGSVITGRYENADGKFRAYRYENGVFTELPPTHPDSSSLHAGEAVSPDGTAILGYGSGTHMWKDGTSQFIARTTSSSGSWAVSNGGGVVMAANSGKLWRWENGTTTQLYPSDNTLLPYIGDLTTDGSAFAGRLYDSAAIWDGGVITNLTNELDPIALGYASLYRTYPYSLTDDTRTIVGTALFKTSANLFAWKAIIWQDGAGILLEEYLANEYAVDLTGWDLTQAIHIAADGTSIVGSGTGPDGLDHAWVYIVPEPAAGAMLIALLLMPSRPRSPRD